MTYQHTSVLMTQEAGEELKAVLKLGTEMEGSGPLEIVFLE